MDEPEYEGSFWNVKWAIVIQFLWNKVQLDQHKGLHLPIAINPVSLSHIPTIISPRTSPIPPLFLRCQIFAEFNAFTMFVSVYRCIHDVCRSCEENSQWWICIVSFLKCSLLKDSIVKHPWYFTPSSASLINRATIHVVGCYIFFS
jgi:hypothetical protein